MCSPAAPLHVLFLRKSFAHDSIDSGLDKGDRNRFAVQPSLAIIRNHPFIVLDVCSKLANRLLELGELRKLSTP